MSCWPCWSGFLKRAQISYSELQDRAPKDVFLIIFCYFFFLIPNTMEKKGSEKTPFFTTLFVSLHVQLNWPHSRALGLGKFQDIFPLRWFRELMVIE